MESDYSNAAALTWVKSIHVVEMFPRILLELTNNFPKELYSLKVKSFSIATKNFAIVYVCLLICEQDAC